MRVPWPEYWLKVAWDIANRSTCDRLNVGAVIVLDKRLLATGYNGSLPGEPHCDDVGHDMQHGHCVRTIHAEVNALLQCAKYGIRCDGAIAYVTHKPCPTCEKLLKGAGIVKIVYDQEYGKKEESC